MTSPTIAVVGCGAIADFFHIPAIVRHPELVRSLILVDPDLERAEAARARIGAAEAVRDHREVADRIHGAIIATPPQYHHPITLDLVRAGVHVLSEKPLAETAAAVDEIIQAAEKSRVSVSVNHTRRLFTSFQEVQRLVASGSLGEIREIDYELGEPFVWPAATDTYFGRKAHGRGVLYDTGAHIVDLVCWWLGGQPEIVNYADDARGGTEAVARVTLRRGEAIARIHLSWLTKLRNIYRVVGSLGAVEGGVYEWSSFTRYDASGRKRKVRTDGNRRLVDFSHKLLDNFIQVIAGRARPIVTAGDARAGIAVIDGCYARRSPLDEPWFDVQKELSHA